MQAESALRGARWRTIGFFLSLLLIALALARFWLQGTQEHAWTLLTAAFVLALAWQLGVSPQGAPGPIGAVSPASRARLVAGMLFFLLGTGWWVYATRCLYVNWAESFDFTWLSWLGSAMLMGLGLELAWRKWEPVHGRKRWMWALVVAILMAVAAAYRMWNLDEFPGEAGASQVEDLQTGQWGWAYVTGYRGRWEYLSHACVPAIGMWLNGPSMLSMRLGLTVISVLKVIPLFLWLRFSVGNVGAVVGTALFTFAHWDVVLARIPHPIQILPAIVFCLLAGPIRRGRPSAYVFLGLLCGFVLHEYVAYRPLILLGPAGALVLSWQDRSVPWWRRLFRPLLTVLLIGSMGIPLFLNRIEGRVWDEYFNGWNRARVQAPYYEPKDDWGTAVRKRAERAGRVAELFYFVGDSSPVKNVAGFPHVDPFTGALLLIGVAFAVSHLFSPVIGLTLVGLLGTLAGTLVLTGNWDVGRAGGAVTYAFAVCGFAAASIYELLGKAWPRFGKAVALVLLAALVSGAAAMNTWHLLRYWSSHDVQVAMRSNLAFLSSWLRENAEPNEQAVGIAPGQFNVLMPNDASFLRGRDIDGLAAWDHMAALRYWMKSPKPTVFFIFAGQGTRGLQEYFEWLVPGTKLEFARDTLNAGADIAFGHFDAPPPNLSERLRQTSCQGARARFEVTNRDPTIPPYVIDTVLPLMDGATWPADLREYTFRRPQPLEKIRVKVEAKLRIDKGGPYGLAMITYAGEAEMKIDGKVRRVGFDQPIPVALEAGEHTMVIEGSFEPITQEPQLRVVWTEPGTPEGAAATPLPFFRVAVPHTDCTPGVVPTFN